MLTPDQIRAARALKNWSQSELARRVGMATPSIGNIEAGKHSPSLSTQEAIREVFDHAGIEFIEGGVCKKRHEMKILEGQKGFHDFYDEVYAEVKTARNKTVCVSNVDERQFVKWQGDQLVEHTERMIRLSVNYKILIRHGDTFHPASSYAEYKWIPEDIFDTVPFYIFGQKLAMLIFGHHPRIYVVSEPEIAASYRKQFDSLWGMAEVPD